MTEKKEDKKEENSTIITLKESQLKELNNTFLEEYSSAMLLKNLKKEKSTTILLSKALFALCDYLIFKKYGKLPKNHSERFRILEEKEDKIYKSVNDVWSKYTDTYTKPCAEDSIELLDSAIKEIAKNETINSDVKIIFEKREKN